MLLDNVASNPCNVIDHPMAGAVRCTHASMWFAGSMEPRKNDSDSIEMPLWVLFVQTVFLSPRQSAWCIVLCSMSESSTRLPLLLFLIPPAQTLRVRLIRAFLVPFHLIGLLSRSHGHCPTRRWAPMETPCIMVCRLVCFWKSSPGKPNSG